MATQAEFGMKTFLAADDMVAYRLVKFLSGGNTVEYADGGEDFIGVIQNEVPSGRAVAVALRTRGRTFKVEMAEAVNAGADVCGASNGRLQTTGNVIGKALNSASGAGSIIEVLFAE